MQRKVNNFYINHKKSMEMLQVDPLDLICELSKENKFYVYQHSDDDGNIFYIGKGTSKFFNSHKSRFKRAYVKSRSNYWKSYVNMYTKNVNVCILKTFYDEKEALEYESYLISLYGLRINGGKLVNHKTFDDANEDYTNKIREAVHKVPVYMYSLEGTKCRDFSSITEAAIYLKVSPTDIACSIGSIKGRVRHTVKKYRFSKENLDKLPKIVYNRKKKIPKPLKKEKVVKTKVPKIKKEPRKIYQYSLTGDFVGEHTDIKNIIGISYGGIRNNLCGITKSCGGYIWAKEKFNKIEPLSKSKRSVNIRCINTETNEEIYFNSISKCEKFLELQLNTLTYYIRKKLNIKGFVVERIQKNLPQKK